MSNEVVIAKKDMAAFLDEILEKCQLLAPVRSRGLTVFKNVRSGGEVCLDFHNSKVPPKKLFFPQSEALFHYSRTRGGVELKGTRLQTSKGVVLGVRPCDARSFVLLDRVFDSEDYKDPYYVEKRKGNVVIGLACSEPRSTCFCTSVGGSPHGKEGLDILLTDVGDRYVVDVMTKRGSELIRDNSLVGDAHRKDLKARDEVWKKAEEAIRSRVQIEGTGEKLRDMFEDPFWDEVHEKCLGCGVCTYLCPTCHCFDVVDEAVDSTGVRVRNWDSCMFPLFTLQASGHNPRQSTRERMRQRMMHKFNYFITNHGVPCCVGCARCIENCPVNLDLREVLDAIATR